MPFQPLPDRGPKSPRSKDFGLLFIRIITAAAFFYYQLVDQLNLARVFVWEKTEWPLVSRLGELKLPFPGVLSVAFVLALAVALLAISIGFFTRLNSLILAALTGFILIVPLGLSSTLNPQTLVIYLAVFLGLALGGAGRASLDYRLAGRKAPKKNGL